MDLADRQQSPLLPHLPSIPLPHAQSLYIPDYYCSAAFDPPPSHQSMQTADSSERESRRMTNLDFEHFRRSLFHVRKMPDALFIYALIYVLIRPLPFYIPLIPLLSAVKLSDFNFSCQQHDNNMIQIITAICEILEFFGSQLQFNKM